MALRGFKIGAKTMKKRKVQLSDKEQIAMMRFWSEVRTLAIISVILLAWGYFGGVV